MGTTVLLRIIHVLFGVFWAGTIFFLAAFLVPAVRRTGPEGGKVMYQLTRSHFIVALPLMAILTILSGLAMFWRTSGGMNAGWMASDPGRVLSLGALAALVAFAIGMTVQRPATLKIAMIVDQIQATGGGAPTPDQSAQIAALQQRAVLSLRWIAALLAVTVVCMAIFRYV